MKKFNLLRKSERKSVGTTLALTVGSPSVDRRYSALKHLTFMLLFLLGSLNVWGATEYELMLTLDVASGAPSGSTSTALTDATLLEYLQDAAPASTDITSASKSGDVYKGKGSGGGSIPQACLKIGKASGGGSIEFTIASTYDDVSKVEVTGWGWKTSTAISVNGSDAQNPTIAQNQAYTFPFELETATKTISISVTTSALCATEIKLYKTKAGGGSTPSVSVTPASWDFENVAKSAAASKEFTITGSNLTGNLTFSVTGGYTLSVNGATPSAGAVNTTLTVSKNTNTIGANNGTLTISGGGLDPSKTVDLTMTVVDDPKPTGTFNKYSGTTLPDGYYVICSGSTTTAMKNTALSGPRIGYATVDIVSNSITNPDESVVWKLENLTGDDAGYFTLYNEAVEKYAAFTNDNGKADVITSVTNYAKFTLKENSSFDLLNKGKTGRYLRLNGANGFANYASGTGETLTLYKKASAPKAVTVDGSIENGNVDVTGAADLSAVAEGTELTLSNAPASGYKLSAYDVYKTGEPSTKVTVTNGKFTMPDYDVTVSASFEAAKVLTDIEITTQASQKTFWVGETFNYDGLVVTAHFDGAADEVVTPTTVSEPTMNVAGEKTITISYTEGTTTKTTNYTIDVKALPTEANPGSVADMIDIWDKLGNQSDMYVRGTIYKINGFFSGKYITYWITDSYDAGAEPNHTNAFELYNGLDFNGASFTAKEDLELGQEVVVKGNLTRFGSSAPYTYEFGANNIIISRPKVLKSIALSGSQPTEFTQGGEFSSEGLIVTATYNYGENAIVTPTSITGYNMLATGNQTVTVSYTETGVTKTATYDISVAAPDLCEHKATISKGEEVNGTFELSVSGELCLDELADNKTSTVLTASPATHYHLSEVTAIVGTVGAISDNSCTISEINASTTITAVFAEDDKATLTFAKGAADGGEAAPVNIEDYAGEVTLPACPFTYTGHYFIGWKKGETEEIYQPGAYTITAADVTADAIAFTAQWEVGNVFEWVATGHGYENNEELGLVNSEPIAIEFAQGEANNAPKYFTSDNTARFYNGGTLTITAPGNYLISKIEFTTGDWGVKENKGTLDGKTWTGLAQEVIFTANATSKVKSIKIYYKEGVAATLEIDDIEMEYTDVVTITPKTVTPPAAASHVSYDIKAGSDDCITLADDQITAKSVTGTATIVATIPDAEGGEYIGTSIEFTVSVSAPDSRKTAKDIDGLETISGDLNADIAYVAKKGTAANAPVIPSGKSYIRIYQNGGYLAINAVKGCLIDEVIVNIPSGCNSTTIAVGTDEENLPTTGGTAATAGNDFSTGTGLNSQNVYLVCLGTTSSTRLEVGAITVKYNGEPAELHHLKLGGEYPTEFEQGAAFSHEGLVVTACYDEGETDTEVVTASATISTPNMNVAGEQTITVSFGGKTAKYTITVNAAAGIDDLTGTWSLVTDAADLMAGMKVIMAQHVENDGAIYTMGDQNNNNRDAVASTVAGTTLAPNFRTRVFVLEDAGNGMFALKSEENGKYLYAASSSSNYLRSQDDVDANAKWAISVSEGVASIVATESSNHNVMQFNSNNKLFSCYGSASQTAIALYARPFDYTRKIAQGVLSTTCLPNGGQIFGASIFEIAYMDYEADGTTPYKIYFDEVEGGIMEAGMPYVILANEGSSHLGVYYTDSENKTAQSKKGLVGYMDESGRALAENEYFIYNNMFYYVSAADAASGRIHISKNHAFINLSAVPGYNNEPISVPAPGRRVSIGNGANAPQVATGIENTGFESEAPRKVLINGELFIIRGEKMYDAKGQLVK